MSAKFIHTFSIVALIFYTLSFLIRTDNSLDVDLGRHIKIGEMIIEDGFIPKINLFSYTYPDFPLINLQYLFGIIIYIGQKLVGINNLLLIKVFIILLSIYLTFLTVGKKSGVILLTLGFIFLHLLRDRIELRPEILSFLFTSLTYFILNEYESKKTRLIFILPLIQLIWINFHIYFMIGFILQTGFLIQFFIQKDLVKFKYLSIILASSILLSLINPYHMDGLLYPLNVFKNYGITVQENQSIFYLEKLGVSDRNFLFFKISAASIIASLIIGFLRKILDFKNIFLPLAGLILGYAHLRSIPYLIFLSLPGTIQNFGSVKSNLISYVLLLITSLFLFLESTLYFNGYYYKFADSKNRAVLKFEEHYKNGMDFVIVHSLKGPIFNNFDVGGYIAYRLYPQEKIFIDSRAEAYPKDFYSYEHATSKGELEDFLILDDKYKFNTIIFVYSDLNPWERNFSKLILNEKGWGLVYLDDYVYILAKRDVIKERVLREVNLENLKPDQFSFINHNSYLRLANYLFNAGFINSGVLFTQEALRIFPDSPVGNLLMGQVLITENWLQASKYITRSKSPIWW